MLNELREAGSDFAKPHAISHYLYFSKESAARSAAVELGQMGFQVDVRLGADEMNWLVLASHTIVPTPDAVEQTSSWFEKIAEYFGGEYDGWEAEVNR